MLHPSDAHWGNLPYKCCVTGTAPTPWECGAVSISSLPLSQATPIGHLDKFISVPNAFDIPDRLPARLMDHAECGRLLRRDGGLELYGDEDQGQARLPGQSEGGGMTKLELHTKRESESGAPAWPRKRNKR